MTINIYLLNAVLLFLTTLYGSIEMPTIAVKMLNKRRIIHRGVTIIVLWSIIMCLEYGFGGANTTDARNYQIWFSRFSGMSLENVFGYNNIEVGFALTNHFIGKITNDYHVYLLITGAFAIAFFMYASCKLTEYKWPVLLVFVGTGLFYGGFNLHAQFLAASVFALAIVCIYTSNVLGYVICIIFATLFQKSAIAMLPLYFLLRHQGSKRYRTIMIGLFVVISFIMMTGIGSIARRLSFFLYQDQYINATVHGSAISYIIKCLSLVVIVIIFTPLFNLDELKDRMAYVGTLFYGTVILWSFSFSMIQRFAYFLILFPMMAISIIFERYKKKYFLAIVLGAYFVIMQLGWI